MNWFRLLPDVFLVEGRKDGAIYDVPKKRLFVLDGDAYRIVRRCESNEPLDEWIDDEGRVLLEALRREGLGMYEDSPAFVDKFLLHAPLDWKGFCLQPPHFHKADWSITNACAGNCDFCGGGQETMSWQTCQTCLRHDRSASAAFFPEDVGGFVRQIAALGCKVLHIRGGDPTAEMEKLESVARAVADVGTVSLAVTTPALGRPTAEIVDFAARTGCRLNVVLFEVPSAVATLAPGENPQAELIDRLTARRLPYYASLFLTTATRGRREEFLENARTRWGGTPSVAEAYPRAVLEPGFRYSHVQENGKKLSPWRSIEEFYFRIRSNGCLEGHFEISADGKLRACAGIERVFGDVAADGLRTALSNGDLFDLWARDKAQVSTCSGCALRFACTDCAAAEALGEAEPLGKEAYCTFDPEGEIRASRWDWSPAEFARVQIHELEESR